MTIEIEQADIEKLASTNGRVVFFPVRHHSPTCAWLVRELARELKPDTILIEGPSDFNERFSELYLPHRLPIAIYSFSRTGEGRRHGAFYPFCLYSPEWQALQVAHELGINARFIDMPWAEVLQTPIAPDELFMHRYADAELSRGKYLETLCKKLGVDDFDGVWDTLFEIEPELNAEEYLRRGHLFCYLLRATGGPTSPTDTTREKYMAQEIRFALQQYPGKVLVVTGGYHSYGLYRLLQQEESPAENSQPEEAPAEEEIRGISLTPYSYARLDSLTGYESGMPHPGFFHRLWYNRKNGDRHTYRELLAQVVITLREKKQPASSADLIAVEQMAQGLARLRGHSEVWHTDLVDGIKAALVKEELTPREVHPFLEAVFKALRGDERGYLAEGTALPPLAREIRRLLHEYRLVPESKEFVVSLKLADAYDLERSRFLHRLTALAIGGFERIGGSDFENRADMAEITEEWRVRWSPEMEANYIEASIYGTTLPEAARARLSERFGAVERNASTAALLLLESALMGLEVLPEAEVTRIIREDGSFFSVSQALGHMLYLFRYDEALGYAGRADLGNLLSETFERGLWLLESLGQPSGQERALMEGIRDLQECFERRGKLELDCERFVGVLRRVSAEPSQLPVARGACGGVLWNLRESGQNELLENLQYFSDPTHLGDFLAGLFFIAREVAQREPELVKAIDRILLAYSRDEFLEALPGLRLAFSFFAPREKHHLAETLLRALGDTSAPLPELTVNPEIAAQALAFEDKLFGVLAKYGLRGGQA